MADLNLKHLGGVNLNIEKIRNFAIIAHVDHGKSTLADRMLEIGGLLEKGRHEEQFLDRNPISRERGITIKLAPVRFNYQDYIFNLIDTPGHVDFSYEVDRTLACIEGVILLVDATQGIQAQTISNALKSIEKNLVIIPVINKIDLPSAMIEKTKRQLINFLGISQSEILMISAKTGQGVENLMNEIIKRIPQPRLIKEEKKIFALIFDSYYDQHRGVVAFVRVFHGQLKKGDKVKLYHSQKEFTIDEVGYFFSNLTPADSLQTGEIGYVVTKLKDIHHVRVGDTLVNVQDKGPGLTGYKRVKPMVFASLFSVDPNEYLNLKNALARLTLNDASLSYSPIYSQALGAGFRVGFLGLLHAEIVQERLEREFDLNLILTTPQVEFKVENNKVYEPIVKITIITPKNYLSAIMNLVFQYRSKFINMNNFSSSEELILTYEMPMSELFSDFFDNLKSVSSGYASLDWEFLHYQKVDAGKLEILINGDSVEEFSIMIVKEKAYFEGQKLLARLRMLIPRQQFEVRLQAKFMGKIIASERIPPFRKNVLVKSGKVLGTGDIGRKRKLIERQKEGKKRLKMIGHIEVPKEAFMKIFKKN